jgi:hypothetical protein
LKDRVYSSPMVRGIQRHERFQNACGKYYSTVKAIRTCKTVSAALSKELISITLGAADETPVYVFKEVVLNRVREQSRRADLVFYVPGWAIVYVEYKTVESGPGSAHGRQLKETLSNLLRNLSYRLSFLEDGKKSDSPITVVSLLVTRRFDVRQPDVIERYSVVSPLGVRDTIRPCDMVSILGCMGRRLPVVAHTSKTKPVLHVTE